MNHEKDLKESLARCLEEAEEWIFESRGCKPEDIMNYDGWAERARNLIAAPLSNEHYKDEAGDNCSMVNADA